MVVDVALKWQDAKVYCAGRNMYLVSINSAAENQFILETIRGWSSFGGVFWIGANSLGTVQWFNFEFAAYLQRSVFFRTGRPSFVIRLKDISRFCVSMLQAFL